MIPNIPDVSIIIPTWNNKEILGQCLQSLYDSKQNLSYQITVIDNGSGDKTCEFLEEEYPQVLIIHNERNLGFSKGCNQGISQAESRYFLILNNDTKVMNGALERLVQFMDDNPEAGLAAPKLLNPDGSTQMSVCMEYTDLKYAFFGGFRLIYPLNKLVKPMALPLEEYGRVREVAWVTGTCMVVRKEILDDVGLLDENIFMYMDDMEWCYRIRKMGWKVFFVPDAIVIHHKHHSSRHQLQEVFKQDYLSKKYFIQKHKSKKKATLFTLFTLVGSMLKLPLHSITYLFQEERRRKEIKYKIDSHWHIVRFILSI